MATCLYVQEQKCARSLRSFEHNNSDESWCGGCVLQIGGMIGMTGTPSLTWVYALLFGVVHPQPEFSLFSTFVDATVLSTKSAGDSVLSYVLSWSFHRSSVYRIFFLYALVFAIVLGPYSPMCTQQDGLQCADSGSTAHSSDLTLL